MGFWWFMLICDMLIPVCMIVGGLLMWKRTPKNINGLFGYRTEMSMKNIDTWQFAHKHCGRLWCIIGLITVIPSIIAHIPFYCSDEDTIGGVGMIVMVVQLIVLIVSIFLTEAAMKRTFNTDGTRK